MSKTTHKVKKKLQKLGALWQCNGSRKPSQLYQTDISLNNKTK